MAWVNAGPRSQAERSVKAFENHVGQLGSGSGNVACAEEGIGGEVEVGSVEPCEGRVGGGMLG
jgi:hypothetical protein